jgi:DMSO/TMAO reductase YedYZ molybdopterin-dependent catalytic subunit
MIGRAAWRAVAAGCGAGLFLTATMLLVRLWLGTPTFPERIADGVLLLIPQQLFSLTLDRLGFAAKPLLFVGIIAAQIVVAGLGGFLYWALAVLLAGRRDLTHPLAGGAIGALLGLAIDFALLPALGIVAPTAARGGVALSAAVAQAGLPGLAYGLALVTFLRLATPPRARRAVPGGAFVVERGAVARRAALALLLSSGGALITALALRRLIDGPPSAAPRANLSPPVATATAPAPTAIAAAGPPTPTATAPAAPTIEVAPTAVAASPPAIAGSIGGALPAAPPPPTAIAPTAVPTAPPLATPTLGASEPAIPAAVAPALTPTAQFYLISKNLVDPAIVGNLWELAIGGLVARPQTVRREEFLTLPPVNFAATLECISNEPGGDLIGTATWAGVPLRTLLIGAGIRPEATHVVFTCADDYVERLPLAQALDPATVLVHTMNDAPLTQKHGFPARLLAAGRYGMKNPKWVVRIDLVNGAIPSYWSQRGWNPDAPVQVFTRIDAPQGATPTGPVAVGGVAYAGGRGISRVEISADSGATWLPAALETPLSPTTWTRWVARWTPLTPGTYTLIARAFEADGTPQVAETTTLNPGGSTGHGRRTVIVTP